MKKNNVVQHLSGVSEGAFSGGVSTKAFTPQVKPEDVKTQTLEAQAKAVRLKKIEEIKTIIDPDTHFPLIDRLSGLFTQEEVDKMAKEDPRIRYILTKKFE
jgi:hypothetical protein